MISSQCTRQTNIPTGQQILSNRELGIGRRLTRLADAIITVNLGLGVAARPVLMILQILAIEFKHSL